MDRPAETQVLGGELPGRVAPFSIEPIHCGHAESVYRIAAQSFPSVWSEKEFCYFLAHENRLCLGVFSEWQGHKRLRAYFLGLLVQGDLDIISLATLPEDRRLGLGSQLLAAVCAKEGVRRAFLEVETSNEAAFSLYSKSGFVLLGRRNEYYGPERDAYLMRWER